MSEYIISVQRCKSPEDKPYIESFVFNAEGNESIADAITKINSQNPMLTSEGKETDKISWDCSCCQGVCGSCAMVINGTPALACKLRFSDIKGNKVKLEPLSKFPLIKDLSVNRDSMHLIPVELELTQEKPYRDAEKDYDVLYEASKCMRCGLCVEVCPNAGPDRSFAGAFLANACYLEFRQAEDKQSKKSFVKKYEKNLGHYCSKSLSCQAVCPAGIDIQKLMTRLNKGR